MSKQDTAEAPAHDFDVPNEKNLRIISTGTRVQIDGLIHRADLNGRTGTIAGCMGRIEDGDARVPVKLDDPVLAEATTETARLVPKIDKMVNIKVSKLKIIDPLGAPAPPPGPVAWGSPRKTEIIMRIKYKWAENSPPGFAILPPMYEDWTQLAQFLGHNLGPREMDFVYGGKAETCPAMMYHCNEYFADLKRKGVVEDWELDPQESS